MIRAVTVAAMGFVLVSTGGCGGAAETDARSPTVTKESPEFQEAKRKAEAIEKANREAERKASRGGDIPH